MYAILLWSKPAINYTRGSSVINEKFRNKKNIYFYSIYEYIHYYIHTHQTAPFIDMYIYIYIPACRGCLRDQTPNQYLSTIKQK